MKALIPIASGVTALDQRKMNSILVPITNAVTGKVTFYLRKLPWPPSSSR